MTNYYDREAWRMGKWAWGREWWYLTPHMFDSKRKLINKQKPRPWW